MKRRLAGILIFAALAIVFLMIAFVPPDSVVLHIVCAIFALVCFVAGLVSLILFATRLILDDSSS